MRNVIKVLTALFLVLGIGRYGASCHLKAQVCFAHGTIIDKASGEVLPMATVSVLESGKGAVANLYGHYRLPLERDSQFTLVFQYVGYEPDTVRLRPKGDTLVDLALDGAMLRAVEVSAAREQASIGTLSIPVSRLKTLPVILGEPDLFKSLAMLPGIATGAEGSSGLYVRGGTRDQNLVLLDGSPVYNTSHLFGFLSVFQPSAVKDIQVIKGGFPARYGGRLSSVVNVTMREGDKQSVKKENSFGLLTSSFVREGPIAEGKGSYLAAGRIAQLGIVSLLTLPSYNNGDPWLIAGMYDFNVKLNMQLNDGSRLYLSAYLGDDVWGSKLKEVGRKSSTLLGWGNKTASLRWTKSFTPRLFGQSMLNFNNFTYWVRLNSKSEKDGEQKLKASSKVQEATLRQWLSWSASASHSLHFGLEAILPTFWPNELHLSQNGRLSEESSRKGERLHAFSGALFLEDEWSVSSKWEINTGLRWAVYRVQGRSFHGPEPRMGIARSLPGSQRLEIGYSRMAQYTHLVTSASNGLANDLWLPATSRVPPQIADQVYVGWSKNFNSISMSTEAFYKELSGQIDLRQGSSFLFNGNLNWEDAILTNGTGHVYGWELLVNKHKGKFTGWAAYTLSWNERRFDGVNRGRPYPFTYDRRHDIGLTANYRISARLQCSASFVYQTGHAITLPVVLHETFEPPWDRTFSLGTRPVYADRNNYRMPDYHRLDINLIYEYYTKKWRDASLSIGAYNVYGQPNPIYINWEGDPIAFKKVTLFRFIPSFNYTVKW